MNLSTKTIEVIHVKSSAELEDYHAIREKVFVEEQQVSLQDEFDEYEKTSIHFLAYYNNQAAGTGRLRVDNQYIKFERIATLNNMRHKGIARAIMQTMETYARKYYNEKTPMLHAQLSAIDLYKKLGWVSIGDNFMECNIAHRMMIKPLK